jgi:hypothetical protein
MVLQRIVNFVPLWLLVLVVVVLEIFSVGLMLVSRRKWGIDRLKLCLQFYGSCSLSEP